MPNQPFHDGEIAVQERAGERDLASRHGAAMSSRIVPGALSFLARQRLVAVSAAGDEGHLWTSVWCGQPGFVQSADGQRVSILPALLAASPDDPVLRRLAVGRDLGMLAIEFASRRRLRINGTVEHISADEIGVLVRESVPNCPKYIQRRQPARRLRRRPRGRQPCERGRAVDEERRALIERTDTAFVGSLHPARGVDASHRGGAPGFIQVVDADDPAYSRLRREQHVHDAGQLRDRSTREPGRARFRARPGRRLFGLGATATSRSSIRSTRPAAPAGTGTSSSRSGSQFDLPCGAALGAARSVTLQSADGAEMIGS